eukprot:GHUV01000330.1.p1 GENE.GHUV01000330.1~~GHUV01000330.1.p1  ORF type:complete len:163 (+),score=49.00 GHUV01000330.1:236-724(+)
MGIKDSAMFRKWARKAFDEIDMDHTGKADYKEVCIGLLKIYDQLNAKMPAHVLAPHRTEMLNLCKKYDKNGDGTIDFDEFLEMAKVLVGTRRNWRDSLLWKYGAVLVLKVVLCPLAAVLIVRGLKQVEAPGAEKVPIAPLASVIEMAVKFASKTAAASVSPS